MFLPTYLEYISTVDGAYDLTGLHYLMLVMVLYLATIVGHAGDGNFHLCIIVDPNDSEEKERAIELSHKVSRYVLITCSQFRRRSSRAQNAMY